MTTPRYTVKVTMPQLHATDVYFVVTDEADLQAKIEQRRSETRADALAAKLERDKAGKVVMHRLSEEWDV